MSETTDILTLVTKTNDGVTATNVGSDFLIIENDDFIGYYRKDKSVIVYNNDEYIFVIKDGHMTKYTKEENN